MVYRSVTPRCHKTYSDGIEITKNSIEDWTICDILQMAAMDGQLSATPSAERMTTTDGNDRLRHPQYHPLWGWQQRMATTVWPAFRFTI